MRCCAFVEIVPESEQTSAQSSRVEETGKHTREQCFLQRKTWDDLEVCFASVD